MLSHGNGCPFRPLSSCHLNLLYDACEKLLKEGLFISPIHELRIAFEFSVIISKYSIFAKSNITAPFKYDTVRKPLQFIDFYVY